MVVDVAPSAVRVEVRDPGGHFTPPREPGGLEDDHGRGLMLVDRLADRWGIGPSGSARVWFEIDRLS